MRDYVFCHPFQYNDKSAGVRALYKLQDQLREKGFDVEQTFNGHPEFDIGDRIAVYSDCTNGDPLNSPRITRLYFYKANYFHWMLNNRTPEQLASELHFTWNKEWYDCENIIQIDTIEHELFNNNDPVERIYETLYYIGKKRFESTCKFDIPDGAPIVTFDPWWPSTREEMADRLRTTKTFITYDADSIILQEAKLCGCKVLIAPEMKEYTLEDEFVPYLYPERFAEMLDNFIHVTQTYWDK